MKVYAVGGSVRDRLLGLPVSDRDYVVVGATPQQMLDAGYRPVGADFPVFLHPVTHEEYALARTERKTAPGYKGFVFHTSPAVTLDEDLQRRDLTINAIAEAADGSLIDPYGGAEDLRRGVLRHVGEAFAEDPVRILRTARFAARFAAQRFYVADETVALMRRMVDAGEVDHLVPERVWQELARGLMEANPSVMFAVLRECGALARILPELDRLFGVPQPFTGQPVIELSSPVDAGAHAMRIIDCAAARRFPLAVRFAALCQHIGAGLTPHSADEARAVELIERLAERLRVPADCRDLARTTARWLREAHQATLLPAERLLALLDGTDALRRPLRFGEFIDACASDFQARPGFADKPYSSRAPLIAALEALQSLDFAAIAKAATGDIGAAIAQRKREALQRLIEERKSP